MSLENSPLIVPTFDVKTDPDPRSSAEHGRPMFKDTEICKIRLAADRHSLPVVPAHEVWKTIDGEPITYAMRFKDQYERWKSGKEQVMTGTPLEYLTLPQAKLFELKALSIYTVETLAALDGKRLANLGMGGRDLKNKAQAYLDTAEKNADVLKLSNENEELKRRLEKLEALAAPPDEGNNGGAVLVNSPFATWEAEDIKTWVREMGQPLPRGNPSHATLVAHADKINDELAKAKASSEAAAA